MFADTLVTSTDFYEVVFASVWVVSARSSVVALFAPAVSPAFGLERKSVVWLIGVAG